MYVDERGADVIREDEGWVTMGSRAGGETEDPRRSLNEFAAELGFIGTDPAKAEFCRRLWSACAGRARFAEAVLRAAAVAGVTVQPESVAFSDWVAELSPRLTLSLGPGDEMAASVLAQLSAVSETTALRALTAVADDLLGSTGINDAEGVIDRLQSAGILTRIDDDTRGALDSHRGQAATRPQG